MFVRITKGNVDAIYECSEARIVPQEDPNQMLITMEQLGTPDGRSIIVDKACPEALGVYYMNAQGKTIDVVFRKEADEPTLSIGDEVFLYDEEWFDGKLEKFDDNERVGSVAIVTLHLKIWVIPLDQIEWNSAKGRWEHYIPKCEKK